MNYEYYLLPQYLRLKTPLSISSRVTKADDTNMLYREGA